MADSGGILGEIVRRKRVDVSARLGAATLSELRGGAARSGRSLKAALARPGARMVMEVKKASPSGGALRPSVDTTVQAIAYRDVADAISVLTDEPYFGGSLADIAAVRAVFDGPILAKDFVVDPRQVVEARLHGADAVLVMLSVLDDRDASTMLVEAHRLGMEAVVEVRDTTELARATALGAAIIGINNRDLRTLEVDLATTERLAPLVPPDRLVLAESGISSRADVLRLSPFADAFLVGTALMRSDRPAAAARALAFGRVKMCGLTDPADVDAAIRAGATHAGFVMVPDTPRAVTRAAAEPLAEAARAKGAATVGVFRNHELRDVVAAARGLMLDAVQLHGSEDGGYVRRLRSLLPECCEIWAARPVGSKVPPPRPGADRFLFDTDVNGRSGGTGQTFDWSKLRGRSELGSSLLAGGLRPDNARAAARVGAWALDVGSGVEAAPGRKDPARIAALFAALRPDARGELAQC